LGGVGIFSDAASNQVGGGLPCRGNLISGNNQNGVRLDNAGSDNWIQGNIIGLSQAGDVIANGSEGILIYSTPATIVGGQWSVGGCTGACNLVSGNGEDGINIRGFASTLNKIWGNFIGTDISGATARPNEESGIKLSSSANNNEIGGTSVETGNLISGNTDHGVYLYLGGANENLIRMNIIGTDFNQEHPLPNDIGIKLDTGPQNNQIRGNIIAGNLSYGINLVGSETTGNQVEDNQIGLDLTSVRESDSRAVIIDGGGILISIGANHNTIGGESPHQGNTITLNPVAGIQVNSSPYNTIQNNIITDNPSRGIFVNGSESYHTHLYDNQIDNNDSAGIQLDPDSYLTTILGNRIYGNLAQGIAVVGSDSNHIIGNEIYDNNLTGIMIYDGGSSNEITQNQIHGNNLDQVLIIGSDSLRNTLSENEITDNQDKKLNNSNGGNKDLEPPTITDILQLPGGDWQVSGTTCPLCKVELFATANVTMSTYAAKTLAGGMGNFSATGVDLGDGQFFDATATDGDGNTSEYASENRGVLDLKVDSIEVVQSIQSLDNDITLFKGKQTYVRVHVSSNWDIPTPTTARLWLSISGESLGPIDPGPHPDCPLEIGVRRYPDRGNLHNAFCFLLPDAWTEVSPLNLIAQVNPDNDPKEMDTSNNVGYALVSFDDTEPIPVKYFMVMYPENLYNRSRIADVFTPADNFTVGNIDGDPEDEIILGDAETHAVTIFEHTHGEYGMGVKTTITSTAVGGYSAGDEIVAGDLDGDGIDEVIIGHFSDNTIDVWTWDDALITPTWVLAVSDYDLGITTLDKMTAGNTDLDGWDEIIVLDVSAHGVKVCDLDGGFTSLNASTNSGTFTCDTFSTSLLNMDQIAVGNLDPGDDSIDEILISDWRDDTVYIYAIEGGSLVLQTELGGSFRGINITQGGSLAIGDLDQYEVDHQEYAEIAVASNDGEGAWLYRWTGSAWELVVLADGWGSKNSTRLITDRGRLEIGAIYDSSNQDEMIAGINAGYSGIQILEKGVPGYWRLIVPDVKFLYETSSMLSRMYPVSGVYERVALMVLSRTDGAPNNYNLYQKLARERALANSGGNSDRHFTYAALYNDEGQIGGGQASGRKTAFPMSIGPDGHVKGQDAPRHEIGHTRDLEHVYVPICGPHSNDVPYPAPLGQIAHPGPEFDFRILNSTFPTATTLISGIAMTGYPRDVHVQGNYAYIALYNNQKEADEYLGGLAIYDITDEENPVFTSLLPLNGGPRRLVVRENYDGKIYAYVADVYGGLYAINVTNPSSPYITDQYQLPEINPDDNNLYRKNAFMFDLHLVGDQLYAVSNPYRGWSEFHDGDIIIFDVAIPSLLRIPNVITATDRPFSVYQDGGHIYVGSESGLEIYALGVYDAPLATHNVGRTWDVVVSNGIAYLGMEIGVKLVDVSDPENPVSLDTRYWNERVYEVEVLGDTLYAATKGMGLQVIDISDPNDIVVVGEYDTPGVIFETSGLYVDPGANRVYLATWDSGVYGMDTGDLIHGFSPQMMSPYEFFDFMSYSSSRESYGCGPQWMSVHSYYELQDEINESWITKENDISGENELMATGDVLHVTGFGDITELSGQMTSLMRLPSDFALSDNPLTSTVHLKLQGGGGTLLADYPLGVSTYDDEDDTSTAILVDSVVSYVTGTTTITLVISETVVATQTVSTNPPTMTLTSPNGGEILSGEFSVSWEAGDLDEDPLTYLVLHSSDGAASWTIVAEIQNETAITLTTAYLAGSTDTYFRVIASDGVNTAYDDSEGPLTIAQRIPDVWIGAPVDGSTLTSEQTVMLFAGAWDPDLKVIDPDSFAWESDLDGPLGTGKELIIDALSPGIHQISVTVTDADGDSNQDAVIVYVGGHRVYLPLVMR